MKLIMPVSSKAGVSYLRYTQMSGCVGLNCVNLVETINMMNIFDAVVSYSHVGGDTLKVLNLKGYP